MTYAPDFSNPNRAPVMGIMDLARLDDAEIAEGYADGRDGLACGDNRSRSYWHGHRNGSRDAGRREGDMWDSILTAAVCPGGRGIDTLAARTDAARDVLRSIGEASAPPMADRTLPSRS
ncbi:MAG: hypothetical protein DI527_00575 [Chelatococcus sp.]|nr:MAG: hypothetical protein DI527_00575 [Chelatococcus sp.]